ncbi:MAG: hypothetical protein AB8F34_07975 [Akkermansiaceae bacterium]
MNRILTFGAALASSAMLVSCDDDGGDDVTVVQDTGVADAINDAIGDKAIGPVPLAEFPVTSLKLTFDNNAGACLGAAFQAGEELEIDFDSVDVTSATDTTANGQADLDIRGGADLIVFGQATEEGYVEGIDTSGGPSTWAIANVYAGTNNAGVLILSNLTFTPLASDQRSITGRFAASAPVDVAFNQQTPNVVADVPNAAGRTIGLPNGGNANVVSVTIYEDVAGLPVEIEALDASQTYEANIGAANYGISVQINNGGEICTVQFAISKAQADALAAGGDAANYINDATLQALLDVLDLNVSLDVSPATDDLADPVAAPVYLIAGTIAGGVTGSYRHDYDSSFGTAETIINSEADRN